jgi:site-specific DNA-methyltransferase (adenine-specific)
MKIDLWQGDCLELMKDIPDGSIDMVLCDPPYGTTACKWDTVIPFEPMWEQLKRIIKPNGAICLFGSEPFSSHLRLSNLKWFKYDWIWKKNTATGGITAKYQPLKDFELISVFCQKRTNYYPIKQPRVWKGEEVFPKNYTVNQKTGHKDHVNKIKPTGKVSYETLVNPKMVIEFDTLSNKSGNKKHPTQKPVALLEYLIKTYTLEGETVLDFTMGSGSTGCAAKNLNRSFIGIELDKDYFEIAKERING